MLLQSLRSNHICYCANWTWLSNVASTGSCQYIDCYFKHDSIHRFHEGQCQIPVTTVPVYPVNSAETQKLKQISTGYILIFDQVVRSAWTFVFIFRYTYLLQGTPCYETTFSFFFSFWRLEKAYVTVQNTLQRDEVKQRRS